MICSLNHFLHEMRLYKSRYEISLMRKAAKISAKAHKRAMKSCMPGMYEYQLEGELISEFIIMYCQMNHNKMPLTFS